MTLIEVYDLQRWEKVAAAEADPAITLTTLDVHQAAAILVGNFAKLPR